MDDILQQLIINKDSVYPELNEFLKKTNCDELLTVLNGVKKNKLFESYFHGLHHSQKVCFFAYLIAKNLNIDDIDLKILLDGALYHDIGRINDSEDNIHGYSAAYRMGKERKDFGSFYEDSLKFTYLKAICDMHSVEDERFKQIFDDYELENSDMEFEKFKLLASILKDADALDRQRFRKTTQVALKEKFLRFDISKKLIYIAKLINDHYSYKIDEILYDKYKEKYEGEANLGCFHGIGFDFFRLESILNYGILSQYEKIKQGVHSTRNFNGNNGNIWVSVVDSNDLKKDGKAYNIFIKNGISFYCLVPHLIEGKKGKNNNGEFEPIDSWEYEDEHFVFDKIDYNNIHSLVIKKEVLNKRIDEINYLCGSCNYDLVSQKISNFIDEIKKRSGISVDVEEANIILNKFKKEVIEYEKKDDDKQKQTNKKFMQTIDGYILALNEVVRKWMMQFYSRILNKDENIRVGDVIADILSRHSDKVKDIYDNDEVVIVLNNLEKKHSKVYV